MIADFSSFNSLFAITEFFKDDDTCKSFLVNERWGDDVVCPYCGKHHCHPRKDGRFRCPYCRRNFSALVGTIFENTKIALRKWFLAMYLVSSHKKGVSSHQLAKDIKVTQKTAWYMLQKIRTLFAQENDCVAVIEGDIELDEAYIGGREKNKHDSKRVENNQGRSLKTKSAVFGIVKRGGEVVAKHVNDTKGATLSSIVRSMVKPGSRIYTDEYIGYNSLKDSEYTHNVVHHGVREFVVGDSHTNTIEGFWAQLKRMIMGIYHFVSAKYLQRYVDESVFRYNTRKGTEGKRFELMFAKSIGVVRYNDITGKVVA